MDDALFDVIVLPVDIDGEIVVTVDDGIFVVVDLCVDISSEVVDDGGNDDESIFRVDIVVVVPVLSVDLVNCDAVVASIVVD